MTTLEESIISRSLTFPKSDRLSVNAPENKEEPIVFAIFLP